MRNSAWLHSRHLIHIYWIREYSWSPPLTLFSSVHSNTYLISECTVFFFFLFKSDPCILRLEDKRSLAFHDLQCYPGPGQCFPSDLINTTVSRTHVPWGIFDHTVFLTSNSHFISSQQPMKITSPCVKQAMREEGISHPRWFQRFKGKHSALRVLEKWEEKEIDDQPPKEGVESGHSVNCPFNLILSLSVLLNADLGQSLILAKETSNAPPVRMKRMSKYLGNF